MVSVPAVVHAVTLISSGDQANHHLTDWDSCSHSRPPESLPEPRSVDPFAALPTDLGRSLDWVELVRVRRQLEDGQPVPGRTSSPIERLTWVFKLSQTKTMGPLMRAVQQPGAAGLGEALALVAAPAAVHAVDQPGLLSWFDGDERGQ